MEFEENLSELHLNSARFYVTLVKKKSNPFMLVSHERECQNVIKNIHTHTHTHTHTHIYTHIHAYIHTYIHTYIHA